MKCLGCGAECPDDAKFCHRCGKKIYENNDDRENTFEKSETKISDNKPAAANEQNVESVSVNNSIENALDNKYTKIGIILGVIGIVIIFISIFAIIINSADNSNSRSVNEYTKATNETTEITTETTTQETTNQTTTISEKIPDEIAMITYSEILLEDYYSEPDFMFTEYYNVVLPEYNLTGKVEGVFKDKNKNKHTYQMIIKFSDDNYTTYSATYLYVDGAEIFDFR